MKRNTSHTIKRAQRFPVILIGEGLLVGAVGGLIVLLYRIALTCAGKWLGEALAFIKGNPLRIAGWFAVFDAACSACRETDKMGTDDIGERNTAG